MTYFTGAHVLINNETSTFKTFDLQYPYEFMGLDYKYWLIFPTTVFGKAAILDFC